MQHRRPTYHRISSHGLFLSSSENFFHLRTTLKLASSSRPPPIGITLSLVSLYSTESTSACQLASTMFADTPTVPHCPSPSPEQISTRTRLAVPDRLLVMTRTL